MTNINKVINRYVRDKIERACLEAYLSQIGFAPMIVDVYLKQADRRKVQADYERERRKNTQRDQDQP